MLIVDQMVKGAFKSMRHIHEFKDQGTQTLMKDTLIFEAPLGILGLIAERVILKTYMRRFLDDRNQELKKIAENMGKDHESNSVKALTSPNTAFTHRGYRPSVRKKYFQGSWSSGQPCTG